MGKSRTRLSGVMWEREGKEGREKRQGTRYSSQEAKGTKTGLVTKMSRLYTEESLGEGQPSIWPGAFREEGSLQTAPCNRSGLRNAGRTWRLGLLLYVKEEPQPFVLDLRPSINSL